MDAVNSQRIAEHVRHALYGWAMDSIHGSSCCVRPYIGLMDAVIKNELGQGHGCARTPEPWTSQSGPKQSER